MSLDTLNNLVVFSSAACLVGWPLAYVLKRRSAAARHAVWLGTLVALMALPVGIFGIFRYDAWVLPASPAPVAAFVQAPKQETPVLLPQRQSTATATFSSPVQTGVDPVRIVESILALGSLAMLFRLLCGFWRARRIVRGATAERDFGGLRVLKTQALKSPATTGLLRPVILLPVEVSTWSQERLDHCLAHEAAHVKRLDSLWNLLAGLALCVFWWQPLAWLAAYKLREESELACDDAVLLTGADSNAYCETLLEVARLGKPAIGVAMAGVSPLKKRLRAMLDGRLRRSPATRFGACLTAAAGLSLGVTLTGVHIQEKKGHTLASKAPWGTFQLPFDFMANTDGPRQEEPFKIRILDERGKPIKGAKVVALQGQHGFTQAVLSGNDGQVVLKPHPISGLMPDSLQVYKRGFAVMGVPSRTLQQGYKFTVSLKPGASIRRRMLSPDGSPASGVRVSVALTTLAGEAKPVINPIATDMAVLSDPEGWVTVNDLPPNALSSFTPMDDRYLYLTDFGSTSRRHAFEQGETSGPRGSTTTGAELKFQAAAIMKVQLVGAPPKAPLALTLTANDGLQQSIALVALDSGKLDVGSLEPGQYWVGLWPDQFGMVAEPRLMDFKAGENRFDLKLNKGRTLKVNVFELDGNPVENCRLRLRRKEPEFASAPPIWFGRQVGESGSFHVTVPPGEYMLDARSYELGSEGSTPIGVDLTKRDQEVELTLPDPSGPKSVRPDQTESKFGEGQPFYGPVQLKGGKTVRLSFVQDCGKSPWLPDGGQAGASLRKSALDLTGFASDEQHLAMRSKHFIRRLFARVELSGGQNSGYMDDIQVTVPHRSAFNVYQTYGDSKRHLNMAAFHAPAQLKTTDLMLGIATGSPKLYCIEGMRGPKLHARSSGVFIELQVPAEILDKDVIIEVLGSAGRVESTSYGPSSSRAVIMNQKVAAGAKVRLLYREREWVTFRGLHLYPNAPR